MRSIPKRLPIIVPCQGPFPFPNPHPSPDYQSIIQGSVPGQIVTETYGSGIPCMCVSPLLIHHGSFSPPPSDSPNCPLHAVVAALQVQASASPLDSNLCVEGALCFFLRRSRILSFSTIERKPNEILIRNLMHQAKLVLGSTWGPRHAKLFPYIARMVAQVSALAT